MATLPGPAGPIQTSRDALGYPTIQARDGRDGAWALGWYHGRDRYLQVQLLLTAASGRLLSVLGDLTMARTLDRSLRLLNLAGGLEAQAATLGACRPEIDAYCAGFNAGTTGRGRLLAKLAGIGPRPLDAPQVLLVYRMACFFGLTSSLVLRKVVLGQLLADGASDAALALLAGEIAIPPDRSVYDQMIWSPLMNMLAVAPPGGSNAVAVAAARSLGGAMILSEPHMEIGRFPPALYAVCIQRAEGGSLLGAGVPGLPWLSLARNDRVGWGLTYGNGDNCALILERCRGGRYQTPNGLADFQRREERVAVRGKAEERWVFWDNDTCSIPGAEEGALPDGDHIGMRWAGLEHVAADVERLMAAMRATTAEEGAASLGGVKGISVNGLFADADGQIAHVLSGVKDDWPAPWSGVLPVPGWLLPVRPPPPLPEAARPRCGTPPDGVLVSANDQRDGPGGERWINLPESVYRKERLDALLTKKERLSQDDLADMAYDEQDGCAARLLPIWAPLVPELDGVAALARWAADQQGPDLPAHRAKAGRFQALYEAVCAALLVRTLGPERAAGLEDLGLGPYLQGRLDDALALALPAVLDAAGLAALIRAAWPAVAQAAEAALPVPVQVPFKHVLFQDKLPAFLGFHLRPLALPGGPTSPFQARLLRLFGEQVAAGPVCHLIFDLSQPGGWYNFAGGAAEQRFGEGFGAGVQGWAAGDFLPIGGPPGAAPRPRRAQG